MLIHPNQICLANKILRYLHRKHKKHPTEFIPLPHREVSPTSDKTVYYKFIRFLVSHNMLLRQERGKHYEYYPNWQEIYRQFG